MTKSLRVYFVEHEDGRRTGTLMRTRESFFDEPPPSAYGRTEAEVLEQLDTALQALRVRSPGELARYLWDERFATRTVRLDVHPATVVKKEPVVGKREIPLRITYAWSKTAGGAYRVMLPRFGWWLVLEDLDIARDVLVHAVSAALLSENASWVFEFRSQGPEHVAEWEPSWLASERIPEDAAAPVTKYENVQEVADEWVARSARQKLAPVIGSDPIFDAEASVFSRTPRPSVLLVGESGVGKTTFVRRLARHLLREQRETKVPRRLWATSADRILAGMMYVGMWQERCLSLVRELSGEGDYLYADRLLPLLARQYDGACIADFFESGVVNGEIALIAECTEAELVEARRRAGTFLDAFHLVRLREPTTNEVVGLLDVYVARKKGLDIHPEGLKRLVRHLDSFRRDVRFPGKALAFVDWMQTLDRKGRLQPADVSALYSKWSGVPVELIADEHSATVADVSAVLESRVIGQPDACRRASEIVARLKAGLQDPDRPIGSLFFVGPTGVGKTELAKELARYLFGSRDKMIRVDMSEYMLGGSASRLIDVGPDVTSLAERVRREPLSLVLFDEIEKAHPEVFDLLLGILGEGRLTDASGRRVDFRMTILVMTSNLGTSDGARAGFDGAAERDYQGTVRKHFRPEFFNRIDRIVSFRELDAKDVLAIVRLELDKAFARAGLERRNLRIRVTDRAREKLAELGHARVGGARPLRRVIEERIMTPLAALIAGDPSLRDRTLTVDAAEATPFTIA
jgi:ATP-dependent Clp protease ATP-binding subunit ClpC